MNFQVCTRIGDARENGMMFFKKLKKIKSITKWGPISEIAWDDETLERIAKKVSSLMCA